MEREIWTGTVCKGQDAEVGEELGNFFTKTLRWLQLLRDFGCVVTIWFKSLELAGIQKYVFDTKWRPRRGRWTATLHTFCDQMCR